MLLSRISDLVNFHVSVKCFEENRSVLKNGKRHSITISLSLFSADHLVLVSMVTSGNSRRRILDGMGGVRTQSIEKTKFALAFQSS